MSEPRDYLEMSFRSIQCFSNDGKLDAQELGKILDIAEQDGEIDQNEVRVLKNIISRIKPDEIDQAMEKKLKEISEKIDN
jgi:aspartate-semialdehyde dehydrogenase